jgi:cytochrome c553
VLPFLGLYALGFLTVGWLTVTQSMALGARPPGWLRGARAASAAGRIGVASIALTTALAGPVAADPWTTLVAEGEQAWSRSPDPANPVACATCHHDPAAVRGWAASFPKLKPLPPPHARVMTLLQVNAEAVARHYRDPAPRRTAVAITAYLTEQGAGRVIAPGIAGGQPVFESRMAALAASVERGARGYGHRCARCHEADAVARTVSDLPALIHARGVPAEVFLERHDPDGSPLAWNGADMADLLAYLVGRRAGRSLGAPILDVSAEAVR